MKISRGFLLVLIIIFIVTSVVIGFSQENKKEGTPQEKTDTKQQKPGEKDLKPKEEKKLEEKKSTPSEEDQQKYGYDEAGLLRESQRNLDRSINALSLVAAFICGLITLFAIAITVAGLTGFFSYRRWTAIRKNIEEDAKYIKEIRNRAEKEFNDMRKEVEETRIPPLGEEPTKELKERLDEFSRKLEFFELLGLSLKPADYTNRGWDFFYKEDYEFALRAFDKAIELEPSNYKAWFGKGAALLKLKRFEEALKTFEKSIELKPDSAHAWNNKGVSLRRLDRFEEALEAYEKAIELNPSYVTAWNNKAGIYIRLGNLDEALEACEKALRIKNDYSSAWFNKACIYALKKDKKNALLNLSKAINFNAKLKEEAREDEDFKDYWEDKDFKKITS